MAGERAQVSVIVNQAADAGNFAVAEWDSTKRSFARQQGGDNIFALLRLERTGAIDERAARFGQRGGVRGPVLAQPVGFRPEMPTLLYDGSMTGWGPELVKRRSDITMEMVEKYLTRMYRTNPDFVFTVTRDFVRNCQTPVLILPDDVPAHPYAVAMECAMLAPKAEVSMYPWKEPKERIPLAVRQIRSFLRSHRPATA